MTTELLKQALKMLVENCEQLENGRQIHNSRNHLGERLEGSLWKENARLASEARDALTAFDSLSDYDKAIQALAPYLPEGWVAQDEDGYMSHDSVMPSPCQHGGGDWKTPPRVNAVSYRLSCLRIPRCDDWRKSLRRITHNSDGTVTVERG